MNVRPLQDRPLTPVTEATGEAPAGSAQAFASLRCNDRDLVISNLRGPVAPLPN
jgi:hypothetical protein